MYIHNVQYMIKDVLWYGCIFFMKQRLFQFLLQNERLEIFLQIYFVFFQRTQEIEKKCTVVSGTCEQFLNGAVHLLRDEGTIIATLGLTIACLFCFLFLEKVLRINLDCDNCPEVNLATKIIFKRTTSCYRNNRTL